MIKINSILVKKDTPIIEVMKVIENEYAKIALVVDVENRLLGTVTDGDIRRGLINNIALQSPVEKIMNAKPLSMNVKTEYKKIHKALINKKVMQIPLVDDSNRVVDIFLSDELRQVLPRENTVVLMAGGLGTRLGKLTSDTPKPMLKVGDKPMLETVIDNLKEHGFSKFIITTFFKAEIIEEYFRDGADFGVEIEYIREKERMGTAGSLSLVKTRNDQPLLIMNGDVLTKVNFSYFIENHIKQNYTASMCVRKYDLQVPYGVVKAENEVIVSLDEKPTQSFTVNAGIYLLNSEVLSKVPANTYFDMPSLFNLLLQEKKRTGVFAIHEYWMDVGRQDDFSKAQTDFKRIF